MFRNTCLSLVGVLVSFTVAFSEAADSPRPVLRVAYFIPTDRKPEPDHVARIDRTLTEVQRFYREGMKQAGYGPLTFELDRDEAGKLRVHEVRGKGPMRDYARDGGGKVRDEVKAALAGKLDIDRETLIIFELLLEWKNGQAIEIGPYVGGGDAHAGTAWVYDDAKLDPKLLASKAPGGYYLRPCSLGEFNSHYVGGVAHELGHALGLPHERERPLDLPRRGTSLMGGGNHTYGNELRGEGSGTFLTAAAALPLSVHPLFTGKKRAAAALTCQIVELTAKAEKGRVALAGRLDGGPKVIGLVAYSDPHSVAGDYDSVTGTSKVDADGRFSLVIEDLEPGLHDLRLRPLGEGGDTKYFQFVYEVDSTGRPLVGPLLEAPWVTRAFAAYQAGDKEQLKSVLEDARKALPDRELLHRKIAHYERLLSAKEPQPLAGVPATTKSVAVSDLKFESATTGWGEALRNQVSPLGDASGLLEVGDTFFESGLYAHAPASHKLRLNRGWKTLTTKYGVQDRHLGSVVFVIKGDGKELFRSQKIADDKVREQNVSVAGVTVLELVVEDAGDGNNSDWGVWLEPRLAR